MRALAPVPNLIGYNNHPHIMCFGSRANLIGYSNHPLIMQSKVSLISGFLAQGFEVGLENCFYLIPLINSQSCEYFHF